MSQQWTLLYADEAKPIPNSGYSKAYGLWINRPFHLINKQTGSRHLDIVANRGVIKTQNGRDSQVWIFDFKTKTIKT